MSVRITILDDYNSATQLFAPWVEEGPWDVTVHKEHIVDTEELVAALSQTDVVVVMRERTSLTEGVLRRLPDLGLIVTTGSWNAAIDMAAAAELGIVVSGTDDGGTATAELTFGLILALLRSIPSEHENLKSGGWQESVGVELEGLTLGLAGRGRLARRVAHIGGAFGMQVVAWSHSLDEKEAESFGARKVTQEDLFRLSDVLSLHLRLSERTNQIVNRSSLSMMRPSAFLINTSRGGLVDEEALIAALKNGTIAGAGLDVYSEEPLPSGHPILEAPNTVLTPHIGYGTESTYRLWFSQIAEDIRAWEQGTPIRVFRNS